MLELAPDGWLAELEQALTQAGAAGVSLPAGAVGEGAEAPGPEMVVALASWLSLAPSSWWIPPE